MWPRQKKKKEEVLNSRVLAWRKIKGCRFLKAYLHGGHLLVICRLLTTFGLERRAQRRQKEKKKTEERERKSEREGMR